MHSSYVSPPRPPPPSSTRQHRPHPPPPFPTQPFSQPRPPPPQHSRHELRSARSNPRLAPRRRSSREEMPPPPLPLSLPANPRSRQPSSTREEKREKERAWRERQERTWRQWEPAPSPAPTPSPPAASVPLDKADSGYASSSGAGQEQEKKEAGVGERVWAGWEAMKTAVGGISASVPALPSLPASSSATDSAPANPNPAPLWSRLTDTVSASYSSVQSAAARVVAPSPSTNEADAVGRDGETDLGRAIKQFHVDRSSTAADVPAWVLTPAELDARARSHSRPSPDPSAGMSASPSLPWLASSAKGELRPAAGRVLSVDDYRARARGRSSERGREPVLKEQQQQGPTKLVSARDRLQRMRDEKRAGVVGSGGR